MLLDHVGERAFSPQSDSDVQPLSSPAPNLEQTVRRILFCAIRTVKSAFSELKILIALIVSECSVQLLCAK